MKRVHSLRAPRPQTLSTTRSEVRVIPFLKAKQPQKQKTKYKKQSPKKKGNYDYNFQRKMIKQITDFQPRTVKRPLVASRPNTGITLWPNRAFYARKERKSRSTCKMQTRNTSHFSGRFFIARVC